MVQILVAAAILPAALLMVFIYKNDKIEKEPTGLLIGLLIAGIISVFPASFIEGLMFAGLASIVGESTTYLVIAIQNFICVALVEEGLKFIILRTTFNKPAFNFVFDALVYSVFISLGFALMENIFYVLGTETLPDAFYLAAMRGVLAIPGHCVDAIFMGCLFGLAKEAAVQGKKGERALYMFLTLFVPVLVHGFYDFSLSVDSDALAIAFWVFVAVCDVIAYRRVKQVSRKDRPVVGSALGPVDSSFPDQR